MSNVYPKAINFLNHDILHKLFLHSASIDLLPSIKHDDVEKISSCQYEYFPSNFGIKAGLVKDNAMALEGLFDMNSEISYIELGPVAIDSQNQPSIFTKLLRIQPENKDEPVK